MVLVREEHRVTAQPELRIAEGLDRATHPVEGGARRERRADTTWRASPNDAVETPDVLLQSAGWLRPRHRRVNGGRNRLVAWRRPGDVLQVDDIWRARSCEARRRPIKQDLESGVSAGEDVETKLQAGCVGAVEG